MILKWIWAVCLFSIGLHATDVETQMQACKDGDVSSCYSVGLALSTGENAENQEKKDLGLEYIRRACQYGEEKACDTMGENYFKDKHYGAAKPYLEKSCTRGLVRACNALGTIYRDGHDVRQNDVLSREYYEKACALKGADACINVAIIYRGGFGVTRSRSKEKEYYKKACDAGSKVGCSSFTRMDNKDRGVEEPGILDKLKSLFN